MVGGLRLGIVSVCVCIGKGKAPCAEQGALTQASVCLLEGIGYLSGVDFDVG